MIHASRIPLWSCAIACLATPLAIGEATMVRSIASGRWSEPTTWDGGRIPSAGDRVQVRSGHSVLFDARVEAPIRSIHVAGTLEFDPDRDVVLSVGLIRVQAGDDPGESGFDAHAGAGDHQADLGAGPGRPALLVGTASRPIPAGRTALIRLAPVAGLDPETCPAIVCHGGRMEFHGAPVGPTWVKLGESAQAGASTIRLDRPVQGWRVGDRVIITSTRHQFHRNEDLTPHVREAPQTEERIIRAVEGARLTLDVPLANVHTVNGASRGEVALLSRNVVVESADPEGVRGHTMYHRGSTGSISFAEFRHLGKPGKLGKYSLHFHQAGDTMRGTSVVGASIWDSGNRWITIHGTNRLVIRDCVGYGSKGHGFFLEDGTEVDNILDGNLAVQALEAASLPGQVIAHDRNEGAGFWWANNRNAFVRNVAVECDGYGFRLEEPDPAGLDEFAAQPFLRFDDNEAHAQRRYGVNLAGTHGLSPPEIADRAGPDSKHPMAIRGLRIWDTHWAFTPSIPGLTVEDLTIERSDYGIWKPVFERQAYRRVTLYQCGKGYANTVGIRPDPARFPAPLEPVDDRAPISVITLVELIEPGRIRVEGYSADDGRIKAVRVNGREVRPLSADFGRWEIILEPTQPPSTAVRSIAEDEAGNVERTPHVLTIIGEPRAATSPPRRHLGH